MPYLEYALYADTIAATLCINRERPELDCQGKCYRSKQLANSFTYSLKEGQQQPAETSLPASQAPVQLKAAPFIAPTMVAFTPAENAFTQGWLLHAPGMGLSQHWGDVASPPPRLAA